MIDVLLSSIVQRILNALWWLAVLGGATAALLCVGLLVFLGTHAA